MAHDIKLDVLTLQIKNSKGKFLNFDKFYTDPADESEGEKLHSFNDLFIEYIKEFGSRFMVHTKTGKALNLDSKNVRYFSNQRIIKGRIEGGTSGIGSKIKKIDNISDEDAFQVSKDDIEAIPYYFLIWMPEDSNLGLVIVQSLGGKTITDIFTAHFRRFVSEYFGNKVSVMLNDLVPKEMIDKTKKDGVINSVVFRRLHLPSDKAEKILGLKYTGQDITVEIKISGLKKVVGSRSAIMQMVNGETAALFDTSSLKDYGIDGEHDTIVKFEHNGKTAQGKASENFRLAPSYYVDEIDIERDEYNHPSFKSIDKYCVSFLGAMKDEIKYVPVNK